MDVSSKSVFENVSQAVLFQKINDICTAVDSVVSAKDLFEVSLTKIIALFAKNNINLKWVHR